MLKETQFVGVGWIRLTQWWTLVNLFLFLYRRGGGVLSTLNI